MLLATHPLRINGRQWKARDLFKSDITRRNASEFEANAEPLRPHLLDGSLVVSFVEGGRERFVRLAPLRQQGGPVAVRVRRKRPLPS